MLGRHVQVALEEAGASVIPVSRNRDQVNGFGSWDLTVWQSLTEFDRLFPGVQAVIHAGAMVPLSSALISEGPMLDANVRACVNLGLWCISRNVPIVHVSGAIIYTENGGRDLDEDAPTGGAMSGGFYGLSKLLGEDALGRLRQQGLKLAIVRPSSIYGFGLPATKMVSRFLALASAGSSIELVPPLQDRIDFVHAADVAKAILAIMRAEAWETFNIASGCPLTVKELAEACVLVTGRGSISADQTQAPKHDPVTRFGLDIGRARHRLGWQPQLDIRQGLGMMLQQRVCQDGHGLLWHLPEDKLR